MTHHMSSCMEAIDPCTDNRIGHPPSRARQWPPSPWTSRLSPLLRRSNPAMGSQTSAPALWQDSAEEPPRANGSLSGQRLTGTCLTRQTIKCKQLIYFSLAS